MFLEPNKMIPNNKKLKNHDNLRELVFKTYNKILPVIESTWPKFNTNFELYLNPRLRSRGGTAKYHRKQMWGRVELNYRLLCENLEHVEQTVVHEIAHIIQMELHTASRGHDVCWQLIMRLLGYPAERTHSMDTRHLNPNRKTYHYDCSCGFTHEMSTLKHKKLQQGVKYRCKRSGKIIGNLAIKPYKFKY